MTDGGMSKARIRAGGAEAREARKRQAAALLARAHAGMALWQLCRHKDCRRLRACGGEVDLCGPYLAPMAWAWVRHAVAAIRAGAAPRTAKRAAERMVPRQRFTIVTRGPDGKRQILGAHGRGRDGADRRPAAAHPLGAAAAPPGRAPRALAARRGAHWWEGLRCVRARRWIGWHDGAWLRVPDAVQRETKCSGAPLIRDRHRLGRSRAPGTRGCNTCARRPRDRGLYFPCCLQERVVSGAHPTRLAGASSRQKRLWRPTRPRPGSRTLFSPSATAWPITWALLPWRARIASVSSAPAGSTT